MPQPVPPVQPDGDTKVPGMVRARVVRPPVFKMAGARKSSAEVPAEVCCTSVRAAPASRA